VPEVGEVDFQLRVLGLVFSSVFRFEKLAAL
jgi:hypothetical protein